VTTQSTAGYATSQNNLENLEPLDFATASNVKEFYYAIRNSTAATIPLIANWSGTRLYNSHYGWGRLWRWFYSIVSLFTNKNPRLAPIEKAVLHTHTTFHSQLKELSLSLDHYQHYLKQLGGGYAIKESDYITTRKKINDWNASYMPFVKMMQTLNNPRVEGLLEYCFKREGPFFDSPLIAKIEMCQKIIDLEGETGGPLPLAAFSKAIKGKIITKLDHEELDRWVRKINSSEVSVNVLHLGLLAISAQNNHGDKVAALELLLKNKGCTVFTQPDPEQIEWRTQLHEGIEVAYNDTILTLDAEISPSLAKNDHTRIFGIRNQPDIVVLFPENRAILGIREEEQKEIDNSKEKFGIECSRFIEISIDGEMARMQRLQPLSSHAWETSYRDKQLIEHLVVFLRNLIKNDVTPINFSTSLMLDDNGQLKSLKPLAAGPFDFNALEDFISDCAGGNLVIFHRLMTESGLATHPTANFYHELLRNAFDGDTTEVEDLAAIYRIEDPKVIDRGVKLINDALIMQRNLCRNPQVRKENINKMILQNHRATGAASRFQFHCNNL